MILPDLLDYNLDVVFCGTAAGDKSAERKAYYAGRGNLFYTVLYMSGFTPRLLQPEEYPELLTFKVGLTDLAKHTHGQDKILKPEDFDTESFRKKIEQYQPKAICFNGKTAAKEYLQLKSTAEVPYGLQQSAINETKVFVAPSTSFSARKYWDDSYYRELKTLVSI